MGASDATSQAWQLDTSMIPTSFVTRGVHFAYLIGPPKVLSRQDGMAAHDAICQALGVEDFSFKYTPGVADPEAGRPSSTSSVFSIQMERKIGRGLFKVTLDHNKPENPVRMLIECSWPSHGGEYAEQEFDEVSDAVFGYLGDAWQRVLAEVRIRGQLASGKNSATEFFVKGPLRLNRASELMEAPMRFVSISYETPAGDPTETNPLNQPKREVKLEVLREDPGWLYVELMSQWPQVASVPDGGQLIDQQRIRTFQNRPSEYLRNCRDYLNDSIFPLFADQ